MYYEEKMIGGKFMCRDTPDGNWVECSIEKTWDRITALQDEVNELRSCIATSANMLGQYS